MSDIIQVFEQEFEPISEKFEIIKALDNHQFDYEFIRTAKKPSVSNNIIWHPGCYVFYGNQRVYRVGRHLGNSRARVLQHIKMDTNSDGYRISDLRGASDAEVILFNVKNQDDKHWVAAVEIYLEIKLKPAIRSRRLG